MSRRVVVIGIGAEGLEGLGPRAREALGEATFLAGGKRHLGLIGRHPAESFPITSNVAELVERLRRRGHDERCVVLASGDPLFFGIAEALADGLGREQIEVLPALSSMQLVFARVGLPWNEAAIASIHGRPLKATLLPLLGKPTIGLFTHDGASPAAVAEYFVAHGLPEYEVWVAERLGTADERVIALPLPELMGRRFDDLNVLILRRCATEPERMARLEPVPAGIPDAQFAQPSSGPVLLTHAEVRAVALSRFRDLPPGPIWDLGAGLGGIAVELARAFRGREVVAVEQSAEQRSYLVKNRARFGAHNMRIVAGEAPEALAQEEPPAAVFLGGSGGRLEAILDLVLDVIVPGGSLVAHFVVLENLALCLDQLRAASWSAETTLVQISHSQPLAGLTAFLPQRPVWIVTGRRS